MALDRFEVSDCRYDSIADLSELDLGWRLRELDRQYAIRTRDDENAVGDRNNFRPQPYIQLAEAFRRLGYEAAVVKVFVHLERKRTWYSNIGTLRKFWRFMLDLFLRYGYSPMRPIYFVLVWAAISAVAFQEGYDHRQIVASKENQIEGTASYLPQLARTQFNALLYAVDTLVPIVDLMERSETHHFAARTAAIGFTLFNPSYAPRAPPYAARRCIGVLWPAPLIAATERSIASQSRAISAAEPVDEQN